MPACLDYGMCACWRAFVYVCRYVWVCDVFMYSCAHASIHVCTYTYTYIHACIQPSKPTYLTLLLNNYSSLPT